MPWRTAEPATVATPSPAVGLVTVDGKTFPLKQAALTGRAEGGLAVSRLVQTYANPFDEPLETLYTLPLPADGAVIAYTVYLGERVIRGEIERREEAREKYQRALEEGRTAGLLEQERANTFTQTLGNVAPGESARVEIEILHPLAFVPAGGESDSSHEWEYRFPTVVGVRYEGAPGRVPDADKLDVNRGADGTPVRLELDLTLADGTADALRPHSSTHDVRVVDSTPACRITLTESARLDRDVVVRWRAATPEVGIRLIEGGGLPGDEGRYGLLTLTPPAVPPATFARDLTVLLDASGSMSGEPLELAKRVVSRLLDDLRPDDRFEILAFANTVVSLTGKHTEVTPAGLRKARKRLAALHAGGATEMATAVREALSPLRAGAQRQVVLITDGYIGFESEVVGLVSRGIPVGARLHVVGIGAAPNRTLLAGAARAGGGVEVAAHDTASAHEAAGRLRRATAAPVLTDVVIGGGACRNVVQAGGADVCAGRPLMAAVELTPQNGDVVVRGRLAGQDDDWVQTVRTDGRRTTPLPLGAFYGREAVADAEMRLCVPSGRAEQEEVLDEIETLGLRHRIATQRTSLVAVAEEPTVDPHDPRRKHRLPVEMPAGVSAEGVGYAHRQTMLHGLRAVMGRMADSSLTLGMQRMEMDAPQSVASAAVLGSFASRLRSLVTRRLHRAVSLPDDALELGLGDMTAAVVVRCDGDVLVLEVECPAEGFVLPGGDDAVEVTTFDGDSFGAAVEVGLSTSPGPHAAGLTLRLALRRNDGANWPEVRCVIRWKSSPPDETETDEDDWAPWTLLCNLDDE